MATVSYALQQVKAHLHEVVPERDIFNVCNDLGHRWRDRKLNPAVTVQLFILQLLAKVAMQGLRHVANISVSVQAICKAKQRLPLKLLMELVGARCPAGPVRSSWKDLALVFCRRHELHDARHTGTGQTLWEGQEPSRNQLRLSDSQKLLALMDFGGIIHKVIALPWARQGIHLPVAPVCALLPADCCWGTRTGELCSPALVDAGRNSRLFPPPSLAGHPSPPQTLTRQKRRQTTTRQTPTRRPSAKPAHAPKTQIPGQAGYARPMEPRTVVPRGSLPGDGKPFPMRC